MKPKKFEIISCPKCGRQYLPAEVFYPKSFFGHPRDVVRDVYGNILDYEDDSLDTYETYTCDKCNTEFEIRAHVSFMSDFKKEGNMDEEYVSPVSKNALFS